jgi:FK506-binding nuclear protein
LYARHGALTVVPGWDLGVTGMQVEGEREIVVPPSMGYGNKKTGDIPPGSTLKFGASQPIARQII